MPKLATPMPATFLAIDASTQSMAFALVKGDKIKEFGKINYNGSNLDEKLKDISKKSFDFFQRYKVDAVVIEDTVYINSPQTVTTLSKCQGALLATAYLSGIEHTYRVSPIAWQSYIGTRLLTTAEKAAVKKESPNKSASWYKARERTIRKQRTMATVNNRFKFNIDDDDIADACGLAMFTIDSWKKVVQYGKK